ncbi:MAG: hypothetical protein QOD12_3181 [Verrucomicrobiota bacterium]
MKSVRIFVSSPGDVGAEREKTREIFDRLQAEFSGLLEVAPYYWEHEPMGAHTDPQSQIEPPSKFDVFVCLLWARLGSRLHPKLHHKPEGGEYASGTEYEVLDALEAWHRSKAPQVLIYRQKNDPVIPAKPKDQREMIIAQYDALQSFVARLTKEDEFFVRGSNSYSGLEQFEMKFEKHMRKVLEGFIPAGVAGSRTAPRSWTGGSPFRGLRHFDFEHAPIFFGRTRAIDEVLAALKQQAADERAFVLVFGGSGVGKSSLVRAGVLPWLVKPGVIDGVRLWRRAVMRPSELNDGDLFDALATSLMRAEALPEIGSDGTGVIELAAMLREKPDGVGMLIKGALSQAAREVQLKEKLEKQPRALFALVVDQLEELVTVERIGGQREGFLRAVDALARSGYVWVIATLRSDFYSRCEESPLLMKLKQGAGQYHLQPPDEVQLGQMIRLPAAASGLIFEEDYKLGERLDDLLRDAAIKSSGALPLLEFALEELYQQRDKETGLLSLETYRRLGGVEGALGRRAEESFLATSEEAQMSFDAVFRQLVTIGAGQGEPTVRRRATKSDLEITPGSQELITRLVTDRLLVADRTENGTDVISIAHEAMLGSWSRLAEWVTQHRESLKIRAQVAENANRWIENNRSSDYLYGGGLPLEKATQVMEANFLNKEEREFVHASLAKIEKQRFHASLEDGEQLPEVSGHLRASFPNVHMEVLTEALQKEDPAIRSNVAVLIGDEAVRELFHELVRLVVKDPAEEVRRAAASSLVQLNQVELFSEVVEGTGKEARSPEVMGALSRIQIAADASESRSLFEDVFRTLESRLRSRIRVQAWLLRLKRGFPILVLVLIPAVLLAAFSAAGFKWLTGLFNYALCQATPSAAMGVFHGITAAVIWGGGITLGLVLYRVVLGREHGPKSYLHPFPAIVAGAFTGLITSSLVLLVISNVYTRGALVTMGWMVENPAAGFWHVFLWQTRAAWPYLIMGTFLGIGMALMINGLRASGRWSQFLTQQTSLTGVRQTWRLLYALVRLAIRFAWPIPAALVIAGALAFSVLRSAPESGPWPHSWTQGLTAGLGRSADSPERLARDLREWKVSPWGQALGIAGDGATQAIGGFFAIVGMGLGIVIMRYGVRVEPRRN